MGGLGKMQADIGLIGLAVMGENLVLNMESKGFTVAVYNRTLEKVRNFIGGRAAGKNILGAYSPAELVSLLKKPRRVMMMVKAGTAVDTLIETLTLRMAEAAGELRYEDAAKIRDTIKKLKLIQ